MTHTLINNGPISTPTSLNRNFQDLVDAFSDGTKDLSVNAVTGAAITADSLSVKGTTTIGTTLTVSDDSTLGTVVSTDTCSIKTLGLLSVENYDLDATSTIVPVQSNITINSILFNYGSFASIEIDGTNNSLDFEESEIQRNATLTNGTYLPAALAAEIEIQLNAIGLLVYSVVYSVSTGFTISNTTNTIFKMLFRTGTNYATTCGKAIGFDIIIDQTTKYTYTSEYNYQIDYYDELATITATNFTNDDILILGVEDPMNSVTITIKNGTGNLVCGSDRVLTQNSRIGFIYNSTTTKWNLLFYSQN